MRGIRPGYITILAPVLLASCARPIPSQAPEPSPSPTPSLAPTPISLVSTATPESATLPLSGLGPYAVGWRRMIEYNDPARHDRKVMASVWYPAAKPAVSTLTAAAADAAPERSGAPYPVVLSSAKAAMTFAPHLASYGFVVVGIVGQDSAEHWGQWLTDYPLDLTFALNQVAATPIKGLEGMIDSDHAGAMGYSFDGYTSLALSGARIDPEFYKAQCANAASMKPAPPQFWLGYVCDMSGGWDAFVANAGPAITKSDDGLWQPITDPRIRAVMPMAPEGAWLLGDRGLAAADRPVLIIAAGDDTINIYDLEAAYIFDHLGAPDRTMISFLGQGHMMIQDPAQIARMHHFAAAFFGVQLQHRQDFAEYLSAESVGKYTDLAWVPPRAP